MTDAADRAHADRVYMAVEALEAIEREYAEKINSARAEVVLAIRYARDAGLAVCPTLQFSTNIHQTMIAHRYDNIPISRPIVRSAP